MIETHYLINHLVVKIDDELLFIEIQKEKLAKATLDIRFNISMSLICLHICLRYNSSFLEDIFCIAVAILLGALVAPSIFNQKMSYLTRYISKLSSCLYANWDILSNYKVSDENHNKIVDEVDLITKKSKKVGFWDKEIINTSIHIFLLIIGFLLFMEIPPNLTIERIVPLFFSFFTAQMLTGFKNLVVIK